MENKKRKEKKKNKKRLNMKKCKHLMDNGYCDYYNCVCPLEIYQQEDCEFYEFD